MYTFSMQDFINERNFQDSLNLNDMEADQKIYSILSEYIALNNFPSTIIITADQQEKYDIKGTDEEKLKANITKITIDGKSIIIKFYIPVIRELFKRVYNGMLFELRDMIRYIVLYNYRRVCQIKYFIDNNIDLAKYDNNKTTFDVDAAYYAMDRDRDLGELVSSVSWRV